MDTIAVDQLSLMCFESVDLMRRVLSYQPCMVDCKCRDKPITSVKQYDALLPFSCQEGQRSEGGCLPTPYAHKGNPHNVIKNLQMNNSIILEFSHQHLRALPVYAPCNG